MNTINRAVITDFGSARTMRPSKKNDQTRPSAETPLLDLATIKNSEALKIEVTTSHIELTLSDAAWSLRWAAPEVLAGDSPDLPSDIWAFGWVCWEVGIGSSAGETIPEARSCDMSGHHWQIAISGVQSGSCHYMQGRSGSIAFGSR